MKFSAFFVGVLCFLAFPCLAAPINTYPAAMSPLSGSETMIGTQNNITVNISALQLSSYTKSTITALTITTALGYTPLGTANVLAGTNITVTPSGNNVTIAAAGSAGGVTSVATNNGLTGGPITSTGTLGLAPIAANSALVNASNGSAVPSAASLPSCSSAGSALIWTSGSGFGCNTFSGGGSVTSVATDSSLTGGPITTTGILSRAALTGDATASAGSNVITLAAVNSSPGSWGSSSSIPNFTVNAKGLITAAASTTLSAALDAAFGSTQGDVLYRGPTTWTTLAPGSSGNCLQTQGAAANPIWGSCGSGGGATSLTNIAALRALTSATTTTVESVLGYSTAGKGGGTFVYVPSDTTSSDNNCTIFVDTVPRRWYRLASGPINVQWCNAQGDGSTDDYASIGYALLIGPAVYVPPSATCYTVSGTLTVSANQVLEGDSQFTSCLKASTANLPLIVDPTHADTTNRNIIIRNLTLDRSTPATAGGDGIHFGSYATNVLIDQMWVQNQYNGISVTSTDASFINNTTTTANYANGLLMTSSSWYPTIQWSLKDIYSDYNEANGFEATGTSGAGCGSMGTWTDLRTFANQLYGVYVVAPDSSDCLQGFRIAGGFIGGDGTPNVGGAGGEIYLDNYNTGLGQNVLQPAYIELAGQGPTGRTEEHSATDQGAGIYLSANVGPTLVMCGVCNTNSYDGLTSFATYTNVDGGNYTNNGRGSGSGRHNGINIAGGNASGVIITGVTAGNTAGSSTQLYGIASAVDYIAVSGANLLNNATSYTALTADPNTLVSGSLPIAANTPPSGVCALSGGAACTMTGNIVMASNNITGVGTLSGAAVTLTGQMQSQDAYITRSMGLAASPDGTSAHFAGPGGGISFSGGLNVNITGALAVTGTVQTPSLYATTSVGIGTSPVVTAGRLDVSGGIQVGSPSGGYLAGNVNAAGTVYGDVGMVTYGNLYAQTSLGVGTAVSGTPGRIDAAIALFSTGANIVALGINTTIPAAGVVNATTAVELNGTPYTNP